MTVGRWLTGGRVYPQIADHIREQIVAGEFAPGTALPSEAELCHRFGVARNTVRRDLAILEDEGLLVTIPSKGRVVPSDSGAAPYRYQQIATSLRYEIEHGPLCPSRNGAPRPTRNTKASSVSTSSPSWGKKRLGKLNAQDVRLFINRVRSECQC